MEYQGLKQRKALVSKFLFYFNMKRGIYDIVAGGNRVISARHKSHTHIFDKISRRKPQGLHFLGIYLLGF